MSRALQTLVLILLAIFVAQGAYAAAEPLPGDTCTAGEEDNFLRSGGKEIPSGHFIVCKSGTWRSILSWDAAAAVTKIGNLTCTNGQILKFNGTTWGCAADSGGTLPALSSANIWVGNVSNAATAVVMSGDATLSNAGVLIIGSNAIGSTEITNASIALADLSATGTASASTYLRGDNTWATIPSSADNLGNHTATTDLLMGAFQVDFSEAAGDKAYWYSNTYGTGVESSTLTNWSAANHRWRIGGTSASTGTEYMLLNTTGLDVNGSVVATSFSGSGASLTALNATNLASGTVPAARLPAYTGDVTKAAGGTALTIAANAVTTTEIAVDTIVAADIAANAITASELASNAVLTVNIANDAVTIAKLAATGTASASTFLRGDNTWAAPAAPAEPAGSWCGLRQVKCANNGIVSYPSLSFGFDGGSAFACKAANITATCDGGTIDVVTCPSGYAGVKLAGTTGGAGQEYVYTCRKT